MLFRSDKAISATEIGEVIAGLSHQDMEAFSSMEIQSSKEEIAGCIQEAFDVADGDGDKMLRGKEINKFGEEWEVFILKQKFKSMDRNGDGVWNEEDMPTVEESMKKLEEATQKMQALTEKLEQLRVLQAGIAIRVLEVQAMGPGVDTPEDLEEVRRIMRTSQQG